MQTPRQRYQNDVHFHTLVNTMFDQIVHCQFTPSELREAAILASIMYEERHTNINTPQAVVDWLNGNKKRPEKADEDLKEIR